MTVLSDEEKATLSIRRMIFHVVGKSLEEPILLDEITPPQHTDFFLERVRSALRGNLFEFRDRSTTEGLLRKISGDSTSFAELSRQLATDFQTRHSKLTSNGVFFVFELLIGERDVIYALIKYDNDDVVRYKLATGDGPQVPKLERFKETFVRKPDAMQKIALVRLADRVGGQIIVKDRSNPAHISDYFEGFLNARRVNSPGDLGEKLVGALKETFKKHRTELPEAVQRAGVNRIYEVLRQGRHTFDPENCEPILTAIFGQLDEKAPLRKTFERKLKDHGVSEETFQIDPQKIKKPTRRIMETKEGTEIRYDEGHEPDIRPREDGRYDIVVVTTEVTKNDLYTGKG